MRVVASSAWRGLLLAAVLLPFAAAAGISVNPWDTTVTPGAWCGNFKAAMDYATQNDCPMVLIWAKEGCGHCENLSNALATYGSSWVSSVTSHGKKVVFCFVEGNSDGQEVDPNKGGVKAFAKGTLVAFPFVCVHWPNRLTERFSGQLLPSSSDKTLSAAALQSLCGEFEAKVESILANVKLDSHVSFRMGDTPCDRLEAVPRTTLAVDVPLVRTNATATAATCVLEFSFGGQTKTETVSWVAGESEKFVRHVLPGDWQVGDTVLVTLKESAGRALAVRHVWAVEEGENSPKNPCWIGDRTADTLAWGEWTMDFDVARDKVAKAQDALTLVLVGGSLWCPDCYSTDRFLIDTPAFRQWAVQNLIACVAIDVANPKGTADTSLLTWNPSRVSDRYCTCNNSEPANEDLRYESGAGFLSRHQVSPTMAREIFSRNQNLLCKSTKEGGLCRPEDADGDGKVYGFKTGIPCLILMRADGTIAGRIYQFNNVSASSDKDLAAHIERLNELVRQAKVAQEEDNDDVSTTDDRIPVASVSPVRATLSAVDGQDVYRIVGKANDRVTFSLTGEADATFTMTAIDVSKATPTTIGSAQGQLNQGVSLTVKLTSDNCTLVVSFPKDGDGYAQGGFFAFTKTTSTEAVYELRSVGGASGGVIGFSHAALNVYEDCGTAQIAVSREAGSAGTASVKVGLSGASGEDVRSRIVWPDQPQTLTWADGEYGEKTLALQLIPDGLQQGDLKLDFALSGLSGTAGDLEWGTKAMTVNVYDADTFGTRVCRHVACETTQTIEGWQSGDEVLFSVVSGALPYGLKLVCEGGRLKVVGTARDFSGRYSAVCSVTLPRTGSRQELTFDFTVVDYDFAARIPSLASERTYGGLPLVEDGRVSALLTVSVPPDGRLSAKYVAGGEAYAYAANGWATFDEANGVLTAVLPGMEPDQGAMTVTLDASGGMVTFADPQDGQTRTFQLAANSWPDGAAAWRGQYTVQLPQTNVVDGVERLNGAAYLALRMVSDESVQAGSMLYAGVLPNGRAVYGSACLRTNAVGHALVPFYHVADGTAAPYAFSGGLALRPNAEQEYRAYRWSVTAAWTPVWTVPDGLERVAEFNVYGGYYDSSEITARFKEDFAGDTDNFEIQAETWNLASGRYGVSSIAVAVAAEMTETNCPALTVGAENPQQVKLAFSPLTGVISGSFAIPFAKRDVPVTFRGIALPGWQGCDVCSEGFVERPWAVGSCSFSDRTGSAGTFRNGCEIRMDRYR